MKTVIGLNRDSQRVEPGTVGLALHLDPRDVLSMKLCPIPSPNGLYGRETLTV